METILFGFKLYELIAYFMIYSFMGWLMETVLCSYHAKKFVKRGFLMGPICPIYGFGMLIIIIVLKPISDHYILLFIFGSLLATSLEFVTGFLLETLFHTTWWDYHDKKYNLLGYISLETSIDWGILTVIMISFIQPQIALFVSSIYVPLRNIILNVLVVLVALDMFYTIHALVDLRIHLVKATQLKKIILDELEKNQLLKKGEKSQLFSTHLLNFNQSVKSKLGDMKHSFEEKLSIMLDDYKEHLSIRSKIQQRLIKSYPNAKSKKYKEAFEDMKQNKGE